MERRCPKVEVAKWPLVVPGRRAAYLSSRRSTPLFLDSDTLSHTPNASYRYRVHPRAPALKVCKDSICSNRIPTPFSPPARHSPARSIASGSITRLVFYIVGRLPLFSVSCPISDTQASWVSYLLAGLLRVRKLTLAGIPKAGSLALTTICRPSSLTSSSFDGSRRDTLSLRNSSLQTRSRHSTTYSESSRTLHLLESGDELTAPVSIW